MYLSRLGKCVFKSYLKKLSFTQRRCLQLSSTLHIKTTKEESVDSVIDLMSFPPESIRNFSIIAHVDHGKSTLADRILEMTGAIEKNESNKQVLDKLQVEKDRGITVKAQSVSIIFKHKNKDYLLNLIDTPGHVDFSYEVSRSLSACQGVILLIDANQGVQAQTVANFYLAFTNELVIIPVLNKIDLKNAKPEMVIEQLKTIFDTDPKEVLKVSAKNGIGINELLSAVVERIPSPAEICKRDAPLRALLYDSWYDKYRGVICQTYINDGSITVGDHVQSCSSGKVFEIKNLAYLSPSEISVPTLYAGQVGVFTIKIKNVTDAKVGDTFHLRNQKVTPLPGFKEVKPMVFAGIYAMDSNDQENLKGAIERLCLNDSSVTITKENSEALGQGWRLGFLGLLHMDVFNTRLEQEHDAQVVVTTPSVPYKVRKITVNDPKKKKKVKINTDDEHIITNPAHWPDYMNMETFEPMVKGTIITPVEYIADIVHFCQERRGEQLDIFNLDTHRAILTYKLPLNEIIVDFFDHLKSLSSGYATFDYEDIGYESSPMVKLEIKLNGQTVEELATIVPSTHAESRGRQICLKIVETLPRQLFMIAVQAAVKSKVLARETIKAARKDVLAKCYGGDVTRKMKLLKSQADGKKKLKMKMIGNLQIPRETFISVLKK